MKKNQKRKLPKVKLIFGLFVLLVLMSLILKPSFARYIYNGLKDYYYESQSFYFNCDKLSTNGSVFQLDNWDGVNAFPVDYHLNSVKNDLVASPESIEYEVKEYECSSNFYTVVAAFGSYSVGDRITKAVYDNLSKTNKGHCQAAATCTITKEEGLIGTTTHADNFTVRIVPNTTLAQNDYVELSVVVESTSPYTKTLRGVVRLNVGIPGISYEITDKGNQPYLDFKITNTLDYYRVVIPFGNYAYGDPIQIDTYNALSDTDKAKCTSALIRLTFNPNIILVDVTSDFYEDAYSYTTQTINGKDYINSITFGVDRVTSISIRFYKTDASNNYTYPYNNQTSIITFEVL